LKPPLGALACLVLLIPACSTDPVIYEHTSLAMGTVAELKVVAWDSPAAESALVAAVAELARIEAITTVYSDSSDVSRLMRQAGSDAVSVDPDLDRILVGARLVAEQSNGAFDPTAGPVVRAWGFPEAPALPDSAAVADAVALVDWEQCVRDDAGWTLGPGMMLDLGGIAKGYAVDRVADRLAEVAGGCLVGVGGDLAVRGSRPGRPGWIIGVQDPREPSRLMLRLRLGGALAVATSGDYQRFFEAEGERWHHILDPRTGWPARGLRSVTVVAPSCELADAWATAAFVLGPEAGLAALEEHPDLEGVLVAEDAAGELVLHRTSGMAAIEVAR
jgi:thiamine biosynthesis lipoprotein